MEKIILREIPRIVELEESYLRSGEMMADELEDLTRKAERLCVTLFGITRQDTIHPPDLRTPWDDWQAYFEFLDIDYEEQEKAFWDAFGIDVDADDGHQLECIDLIGRPLVCALRQLHPAASLRFASGRKTDEQLVAEAEAWGRWLQSNKRSDGGNDR